MFDSRTVASLSADEGAVLKTLAGSEIAYISYSTYSHEVRISNSKRKESTIYVIADVIRELISKGLIEKCDWEDEHRSISLTNLGRQVLAQMSV